MTLKKKLLIASAIIIPIGIIAVILIKSPVPSIHNDIDGSLYDGIDVAKEMYDDIDFYNLTHDVTGALNEYGRSLM